jgi:hypothetical protein
MSMRVGGRLSAGVDEVWTQYSDILTLTHTYTYSHSPIHIRAHDQVYKYKGFLQIIGVEKDKIQETNKA